MGRFVGFFQDSLKDLEPMLRFSNMGVYYIMALGGFGLFLGEEYGFRKEIIAVYGFSIAAWLRKIEM